MSETTEKKTKIIGRGVASARGVARKKFSHEDANPKNGLFIGHIEDVAVNMIKIGEETTGMPSFNGMEIPRIAITFASNAQEPSNRKYTTLSFTACESNVETIPGGKKEWSVNAIFDWFKHLYDVYVLKGRELTDTEAEALSLPFVDFDEEGNYVSIEPEEVANGWKTLFENFANLMNTGKDGSPVYKTNDGKPISIWFKLLRCVKNKKGWQNIQNGSLVFPTFIGEGCVELFKSNQAPAIRIDSIRESITPRVEDKPKTPSNIAGAAPYGGGVEVAGGMVGDGFGGDGIPMEESPF